MDIKIGFNQETIGFAIFIAGAIWRAFITPRMQAEVVKWVNKIGGAKKIMEFVEKAAEYTSWTGAERRKWAYDEIQKWAMKKIGCTIPESYLNEAIEFALNKFKKKFK